MLMPSAISLCANMCERPKYMDDDAGCWQSQLRILLMIRVLIIRKIAGLPSSAASAEDTGFQTFHCLPSTSTAQHCPKLELRVSEINPLANVSVTPIASQGCFDTDAGFFCTSFHSTWAQAFRIETHRVLYPMELRLIAATSSKLRQVTSL